MSLSSEQIAALIEAVRETGRRDIMPSFRNLSPDKINTKTGAKDLVTVADRAAENRLTEAVSGILPDAVVVGEEAVSADPSILEALKTAGTAVIVDPIDGTANFVAGLAVFGTIIAVVENGKTVFGLLYDPVLDDWVFATRGRGAYYASGRQDPQPISTRGARPLSAAKGFVSLDNLDATARTLVVKDYEPVYQLQDIRCSCHEYRLLASGQADFLRSFLLNPWDHAAGILVLLEAGGWAKVAGITDYAPTIHEGHVIAASCREIGEQIRSLTA